MAYVRVRGNVKAVGLDEMTVPDVARSVRRPMKAGEIPGFEDKFNKLWAIFPGNRRELRDRGEAIKYFSEMGIGEFCTLVENFGSWCQYWRSFQEAEKRFIPRLHNWAAREQYKQAAPPPRMVGEWRRQAEAIQTAEKVYIAAEKPSSLSDVQTIGKPLTEVELGDLQGLMKSLRKLG